MTERWREWGLSFEEWKDCLGAAAELAELSGGERTASAEEIAAQLAVAKAAEEFPEFPQPSDTPTRSIPIGAH